MPTGPPPKVHGRRRTPAPVFDWKPAPGVGWQHTPVPPPDGLTPASQRAWQLWMRSWWASHWDVADVPVLSLIVRLYDQVERETATATIRTELRLLMDGFGLSPKGRQSLRWLPPAPAEEPRRRAEPNPYADLRAIHVIAPHADLDA